MHILLVEPDKVLAKTYIASLERAGHSVDWQASAQGSIATIDKKIPAVIILEVQLVGHNGIEFLFELRSYKDLQSIPVILLTTVPTHDLGLTEDAKKQLGILEYLYKPQSNLKTLLMTVEKVTRET